MQRHPVLWLSIILLTAGLLLALLVYDVLARKPPGGFDVYLDSDSDTDPVAGAQDMPYEDIEATLREYEYITADEPVFPHDLSKYVTCRQIISAEVLSHIIQQEQECPSIVTGNEFDFDVVIAYWDWGACRKPATLVVVTVAQRHLLSVDTDRDRGGCDSSAELRALGIELR